MSAPVSYEVIMKNRFFAIIALCVLVLNLCGSTLAHTKGSKTQTNQLVALLPASDGVLTLDVKRFFADALPKILSANQPMLAGILAKIDEVKSKTGIDIREFEYFAAGVTAKKINAKDYDIDPVIIARGRINAGALIAMAKLAANGKYREVKVGDKTIYIFTAKEIAKQQKPKNLTPKKAEMIDKMIGRLSREIAVTAIDANTLAFGALPLVRQTLEARTHVGSDLTGLLERKEISVLNFAAKVPSGMHAFLPLGNDELGKNLNSIRYIAGNIDVGGESTMLHMMAKTLQNEQAQGLLETLEGLQIVGKAFLRSAKGADKQVYARLIENVKFSVKGNEVAFDLQIPQSEIDVLIGLIK